MKRFVRIRLRKMMCASMVALILYEPFWMSRALAQELILETDTSSAITSTTVEVNTTEQNSLVSNEIQVVDNVQGDVDLTGDTLAVPSSTPAPTLPDPISTPSATLVIQDDPLVPNSQPSQSNVVIENQAEVSSSTQAEAITGINTQDSGGSAQMQTSDAIAMASGMTLVNTTLINSSIEVSVIAIIDGWSGDIIVDPLTSLANINPNVTVVNGQTLIDSTAQAESISGENTQLASSSAEMTTGQSTALSSANILANATILGTDIFTLNPLNTWLWTGSILNWESLGSISPGRAISNMIASNQPKCSTGCDANIDINNQARVETEVSALAITGENNQSASQSASMQTGNAYSGAINTTIVNTTMIDSKYRYLNLLLYGNWTGNLVFAYPDLVVSGSAPEKVYEGDEINYQLAIKNSGYAKSEQVAMNSIFESNQLALQNDIKEWPSLPAHSTLLVSYKIPTEGRAGENITLRSSATSGNVEQSDSNNQVSLSTLVLPRIESKSSEEQQVDSDLQPPILKLNGSNNVGEYVFAGDSVTYDMKLGNEGRSMSRDTVLYQTFYTPSGEKISDFGGKLGDIGDFQTKNIHFVMKMGDNLPRGNYYTLSQARGRMENGETVSSNVVRSEIVVKQKVVSAVPSITEVKVEALSPEQAQILGQAISQSSCRECLSFPWYIAITIGSIAYYLNTWKRQEYEKTVRWGLALPLSAYAGLILSNPGCTNGIIMLPSAGFMCQWFLVFAYLIYFIVMWRPRAMRRNLNISQ